MCLCVWGTHTQTHVCAKETFFIKPLCVRVHARTRRCTHMMRVCSLLLKPTVHITFNSIFPDKAHTCTAYQFKSQPNTKHKGNLIYCIHITLVQRLHANRVGGKVGRDRIPWYSSCRSLVADVWDMAPIWMMGEGEKIALKKNFFLPYIYTDFFTYRQLTVSYVMCIVTKITRLFN
jgi:hypothetical protein